jgi:hypothetical protein
MLDEIVDREPAQSQFARFLNSRLDQREAESVTGRRAGHWHERANLWTNLRDLVHWIDRGRGPG